jgi:hypothetical protein
MSGSESWAASQAFKDSQRVIFVSHVLTIRKLSAARGPISGYSYPALSFGLVVNHIYKVGMRHVSIRASLLVFAIIVLFAGCDTPGPDTSAQNIGTVEWKSDASEMFVYYYKYNTAVNSSLAYALSTFHTDGSVDQTIPIDPKPTSDPPLLFVSKDGLSAVSQMGANIYKVDLTNGATTLLAQKVTLFVVSPDLKTAVVTPSPVSALIKTVSVLDLTGPTVRETRHWDVSYVVPSNGVWLSGGHFALSTTEGGFYVNIYDTTGAKLDSISEAQLQFHKGKYVEQTNELFFTRPIAGASDGIDKVELESRLRESLVVPTSNETTENFDVSPDGKLLVYDYVDSNSADRGSVQLFAMNVSSGTKTKVVDDVSWGAFLSPHSDQVAYAHKSHDYYYDLKVHPVTLP